MTIESPLTFGPYRVTGALGSGGMGVVYRAVDTATGEAVAVKTLATASEAVRTAFRREVRALARLVHPGVVRILGEGLEGATPWYAMELVEGPTLRAFANRAAGPGATTVVNPPRTAVFAPGAAPAGAAPAGAAPDAPAPSIDPRDLARLLELVARVCEPLAFLHGEGIVHGDLKPDNVLVRAGRDPVLVDFGIATLFAASGREAIDDARAGWGTVQYMAPEQVRGELVDARADLYALGCILYDLVAGRPPFAGSRAAAVAAAHVASVPEPLSRLVAGVPEPLSRLVARLLAKDPRDRVGYAEEVAAELAAIAGRAPNRPRARPYLYRPRFAGREAALARLGRMVDRLGEGRGGLVAVAGESGVGKTRLLLEAARLAAGAGVRVVAGECPPRAAPRPLEPLARLFESLADCARAPGAAPAGAATIPAPHLAVLAAYSPDLAALAAGLAEPEPAPPEAARERLFAALAAALRALAPVLVVLDDLQRADDLTLGWLDELAARRALDRSGVLVAVAYRAEEAADRLVALGAHDGVERLALGRLDEREAVEAAAGMLALDRLPPELEPLVARAGGNPFFAGEFLRAAVDEGLVTRAAGGRWALAPDRGALAARLAVPTTVRDLVARRLEGLGAAAAALAAAAAVAGPEASMAVVSAVADRSEADLGVALADLRRRGVLEQPAPDRVRFCHDTVREIAYARVDEASRALLHGRAARAIEAATDPARWPLATLGRHWREAGETERAAERFLAAARRARAQYAFVEAERAYRAYLELARPSPERVAARNELGGEVLRARGRGREAVAEHLGAIAEAEAVGDAAGRASALRLLGSAHEALGDPDAARDAFARAREAARALGDRRVEGEAVCGLALVDAGRGMLDEAETGYGEAVRIAREVGHRDLEARTLNNLVGLLSDAGRSEEAVAIAHDALRIHRELGNRRLAAITLGNLGVLHYRLSRLDEARRLQEEALRIHRELGNRRFEAMALINLAVVEVTAGQVAAAAARYERALEATRAVGDRRTEGFALTNLGRVRYLQGDLARARTLYDEAIAVHRETANRRLEVITRGFLAAVDRREGRYDEAERGAAEVVEALDAIGDTVFAAVFACEVGHAKLARGREAGGELERARREAAGREPDADLDEAIAALAAAVAARPETLRHGEVAPHADHEPAVQVEHIEDDAGR